jgi:predicted transcriptional regulator
MINALNDLFALTAGEIMSRNLVVIPREMSLEGAARTLGRSGVTGAPVVDSEGRCIGVLSATDFMTKVEHLHDLQKEKDDTVCKPWQIPGCVAESDCRVEDCMTHDPVLVGASVKIGELARMMMDAHIHRVIVVDTATDQPIGIVSSIDILAALARAARYEEPTAHPDEILAGVV